MLLENENLMNYETEKNFIMSPYNKSSFYIPGKGITVDEDGNIRFYPLDDINEFVFGQDIEPEYLFDDYLLTIEEKDIIKQLQKANQALNKNNISAVYMRYEKSELYFFITTEDNPETFYKISNDKLSEVTQEKLPKIPQNTIEKAPYIKF